MGCFGNIEVASPKHAAVGSVKVEGVRNGVKIWQRKILY